MTKPMLLFAMLLCALLAQQAQAGYWVATMNSAPSPAVLDPDRVTHLLVTGRGSELKFLFQLSAKTRAERYLKLYPDHQIVLITHDETGAADQPNNLRRWGFRTVKSSKGTLNAAVLLRELRVFRKIATLDVYAHTSAIYGAQLGGGVNRMGPRDESYDALKTHFVDGAYAIFHGCNSGFLMAPWYAERWDIPVMGSFSSTDFERRHSDGRFYRNESWAKPAGPWSTDSSKENYRMKPDNVTYRGIWGAYKDGGLGFFKTFCARGADRRCVATMAEALASFTTTVPVKSHDDRPALRGALKEFMCPTGNRNPSKFLECAKKIDRIVAGGGADGDDPFGGRSLECDFRGCRFRMTRCSPAAPDSPELRCDLVNPASRSGTWLREVRAYAEGLRALERDGFRLR